MLAVLVVTSVVTGFLFFNYYSTNLPTVPQSGRTGPSTVFAAGDIADCRTTTDESTAELVEGIKGTVITLGDHAYESGSADEFRECYEPTWGQFKGRTRPAPGNHDYNTRDASGYFDYFGEAAGDPEKGYYSYDLGEWHVVALNSNCEDIAGICDASSPQVRWLKEDLVENEKPCTLAYFHHPLFTSGAYRPGVPDVKPLWEALYAADADVVLNSHDHNYQRFAPQDPDGRKDSNRGIREFVVGTGGTFLYPIPQGAPIANSEAQTDLTHGVLKLALRADGYEWEFVPVEGKTFTDSGRASCH